VARLWEVKHYPLEERALAWQDVDMPREAKVIGLSVIDLNQSTKNPKTVIALRAIVHEGDGKRKNGREVRHFMVAKTGDVFEQKLRYIGSTPDGGWHAFERPLVPPQ
jgi:hypothetical protein